MEDGSYQGVSGGPMSEKSLNPIREDAVVGGLMGTLQVKKGGGGLKPTHGCV